MNAVHRPAAALAKGLTAVCLACASVAVAAAEAPPAPFTLSEAITTGKAQFAVRLRIENVEDDALARSAFADTFRARFGYETRSWRGIAALIEVDHLGALGGETYNSTRNGRTDRPVVSDPPATDLNQAMLKLTGAEDDLAMGRQRLVLDNQRFIGGVAWRQNEQTFDAVTLRSRRIPRTSLTYSYIANVNRVFGPDAGSPPADLRSKAHLLHATWDFKDKGKLSAFGHWLDFDNTPALSHQNLGVLWTGRRALGKSGWALPWSLSYANQSDFGNNAVDYAAHYYQLETGLARDALALRVGIEVLEGDPSRPERRFQTPLATLHAFQGWADKFLATPPQGVRDAYIALTLRRAGFEGQLAWHGFRAEAVSRHYGDEWDASISRKLFGNTDVLLKAARYDADGFAADTTKIWLQLNTEFTTH
jgi:hypothetical protein